MSWIERAPLEERLLAAVRAPGPALATLVGPRRSGVTELLRRVLRGLEWRRVAFTATLAAPGVRLERAAIAFERAGIPRPEGAAAWSDWAGALLDDLRTGRSPVVVAIDDAPLLLDSDEDAAAALAALWAGARAHALPLHLVLAGHDADALDRWADQVLGVPAPQRIRVPPVRVDELAAHLPDWPPEERFLIRACLGSSVETLGRVDPSLRATTNLLRLAIDPDGPLHDLPAQRLREQFQKPERYAGIVSALAEGAHDWGGIRRANPAFRSGNQLAPYLSALQEHGWVTPERSLDAAPESRGRRYRLGDPFVAFWHAVAEPARDRLLAGESPTRVAREMPLDDHLERVFPILCRLALLEGVVDDRLTRRIPVRAREIGGLWGADYHLPISGTLRNGAVVYGVGVWGRTAEEADAETALEALRATRYGYGRESRLVLVVTSRGATEGLVRRVARDHRLLLVPLQSLF
ncbi:AAA family ATPase [Gaopeijia maritima]|uniref:AAA family ATPase n=1 Tax=Gaopeijia maritima TaxID=3119007 RepID=UPI00327C3F7B